MKVSAYDTTALQGYKIEEIKKALVTILGNEGPGESYRISEHPRTKQNGVFELLPCAHDIPPFGHPLTIEAFGGAMLFIDVRNFTRRAMNGEVAITSQLDYGTLINRAYAEMAASVDQQNLLSIGSLHTTIYTRWVSDAIGKRLGLPIENQVVLTVLVGFFYICQFLDFGETVDEREKVKAAQLISRSTFIPVEDILRILDSIEAPPGNTALGLIALLKTYGQSVRFDQMNIGLLYSILYMGSWFGANKNEIIALALEHPPTFIGMLISAVEERGYRKTAIGELLKVYDKRNEGEGMIKVFWHLPTNPQS